jgi:NAD-dependent deacetylase
MSISAAAERLREAKRVCVLTGSGISAESGIPTFRGAQTGLWEKFNPHELATPEAFERDPQLVWRWYEWRRQLVRAATPNPGHVALVDLAARLPAMALVTQNVDGLHQRAGSREVIEFHGNIMRDRCVIEGTIAERSASSNAERPCCARCGAPLRPDVVWFGEAIDPAVLRAADEAAMGCDAFLSVGTSSLVYPAAGLAEIARQHGAAIIEINLESTAMSEMADWCLQGPAGEVLPALLKAL